MVRTDGVLDLVVKDRQEAAEYIEAILRKPGLMFEMMGNAVISGKCMSRYNKWLLWPVLLGILALPFDVIPLALKRD
jgi:hypothetical protein